MKVITLALSLFLPLATLRADSPLKPQGHAKITKNEAQHIALKQFPGAHVVAAKLQRNGASLIWSVEMTKDGQTLKPVAVDAMTGQTAPAASAKP